MNAPVVDLTFPHVWQARILPERPMILPPKSFAYPAQAEEVERGALEVLVRPDNSVEPFLATCALGFRDPAVPTGIWSCHNPVEMCAVSGGYAYVIDTGSPTRFSMIPFRPVLQVLPVFAEGLLLFVGHHAILAWGTNGEEWQSAKLSDEGISAVSLEAGKLHGRGWNMMSDKETPFILDLSTGDKI